MAHPDAMQIGYTPLNQGARRLVSQDSRDRPWNESAGVGPEPAISQVRRPEPDGSHRPCQPEVSFFADDAQGSISHLI
jgi:hypothetical protein